ncbi:MAG TPA: hypothetical protein EYP14_08600, partial [Planctomycetaceae bacterium]|nr:hypothetical protein [Planctomycetaceae bacterium]
MRRSGLLLLAFGALRLLGPNPESLLVTVGAGEVRLKNGMSISGTPAPIQSLNTVVQRGPAEIVSYPILMIETGLQRYFVPARQVLEINRDADLSLYETFTLEQRKTSQSRVVQSVGAFLAVTPFDEFGRRRVTLQTPNGPMEVIQGITQLHPKYVTVTALNCAWQHGIATTSLPPETLDRILRHATDPSNPQDRLAIARFYLQAGMFLQAQRELDSIREEFPGLKERVDELSRRVRELVGQRLVRELRLRQRAGQHFLAYTAARQFPSTNLSGDVLRQARELIDEYEQRRNQIETCKLLLGELQAELTDPQQQRA